jgi:hypothetical protein
VLESVGRAPPPAFLRPCRWCSRRSPLASCLPRPSLATPLPCRSTAARSTLSQCRGRRGQPAAGFARFGRVFPWACAGTVTGARPSVAAVGHPRAGVSQARVHPLLCLCGRRRREGKYPIGGGVSIGGGSRLALTSSTWCSPQRGQNLHRRGADVSSPRSERRRIARVCVARLVRAASIPTVTPARVSVISCCSRTPLLSLLPL